MVDVGKREDLNRRFDKGYKLTSLRKKKQDHLDWQYVAEKHGYKDEPSMFKSLYIDEELSLNDISKKLQLPVSTIRFRIKRLDIDLRPRGGSNNTIDTKIHEALRTIGKSLPELIEEHQSLYSVAAIYDLSTSSLYRYWKKYHGGDNG